VSASRDADRRYPPVSLTPLTPAFPREEPSHPPIVVNGRVLPPSAYRPSTFLELGDTVAWWGSLALLGVLLAGAGILVGADQGEWLAISGVSLFFATAVLAGAERTEAATAVGVAAIVWTSAGIALVLGTDANLWASLLGFAAVGATAVALGSIGAFRVRARSKRIRAPTG
jgi:hypothetical protein